MTWVKRNLFFLIGGFLALVLTAGAAFYLLQNYKLRTDKKEKLNAEYTELQQLTNMDPGPGDGKKVDNIAAAREYAKDIGGFIQRSGKYFRPIPRIPEVTENTNVITDHEFASALRDTLGLLTREAQVGSVLLPPAYDFSFHAIKSKITFAPESLPPLAVQLGEVKAICEVLFNAKINALDSVRRERVAPVDPMEMADYLDVPSVTNELAVLTPYEITIRCFSGELAAVLAGFAASPYTVTVKRISVEPSGYTPAAPTEAGVVMAAAPQPVMPAMRGEDGEERPRYPAYAAPTYAAPAAGLPRGILPTVLNELPFRVTLRLEVVKRLEATQ